MILTENSTSLQQVVEVLQGSGIVGIPTETVYGLAADARLDEAVVKIYTTKNRPQFNPLIVHVASIEEAQQYAQFNDIAYKVAAAFWPGSLTLVLPRKTDCALSHLVTAGLETVAIRVPRHPTALRLLNVYQGPLAAPSANKSMEISPTRAEDVIQSLGEDILVLDGGPCSVGVESTILDLSEDKPLLLRPGGIPLEDLEQIVGSIEIAKFSASIKSPGMMKRHYAPKIPMRLNADYKREGEAFLGFGSCCDVTLNLSPSGNLMEAAANLFQMMRQLDESKLYTGIAVAPIPSYGLGLAINDRLMRAASLEETTGN